MARAETALLDGVINGYGARDSINLYDSVVHTYGRVRQAEVVVDFSNIADFAAGALPTEGTKHFVIPAGSTINTATIVVESDVQTLTSLAVGLKDTVNGTLVGADDTLVTDADAIEANNDLRACSTS